MASRAKARRHRRVLALPGTPDVGNTTARSNAYTAASLQRPCGFTRAISPVVFLQQEYVELCFTISFCDKQHSYSRSFLVVFLAVSFPTRERALPNSAATEATTVTPTRAPLGRKGKHDEGQPSDTAHVCPLPFFLRADQTGLREKETKSPAKSSISHFTGSTFS